MAVKTKLCKPLQILYWNADGVERDKLLLGVVLEREAIDIALIGETRLRPNSKLKIRNYTTYHTPGPNSPHGGTAVIIKSNIQHRHLTTPTLKNLQLTAIEISTHTETIAIGAVYHSPSLTLQNDDLDKIYNMCDSFIYAGDMNAKHTQWNSRIVSTRGRILASHAAVNEYEVLAPQEHTHYPRNPEHSSDVLDIVLYKSKGHISKIETMAEFNSDHDPVKLEIDLDPTRTMIKPRLTTTVDWPFFRSQINAALPDVIQTDNRYELDETIKTLTDTISHFKAKSTTYITPDKYIKHLNPEILNLIHIKKLLRKRYQRQRQRRDKTELNFLTKRIRILLQDYRIRQFDQAAAHAIEANQLWQLTRRLKTTKKPTATAIVTEQGIAYRSQDKARVIADTLQKQFCPNTAHQDDQTNRWHRDVRVEVKNFLATTPTTAACPVSTSEVKKIVKDSRRNSAPGPDGISYETLKNLPPKAFKTLTYIYNTALSLHYFPTPWKLAHVITIPKPGKSPLLPQNRRPLSLLSTLGKIYEKIVLHRIAHHALQNTPDTQFGFVPHRSSTLQLLRLTKYIKTGFAKLQHTAAIFLDVEKAYDTVWIPGLIYKLIKFEFPDTYTHIISSYLTKRSFRVKIEDALSSPRKTHAGVPQGSILAPTLYNLYTADIPTHQDSQIAQYADDTVLFYRSFDMTKCVNTVTQHMDTINKWSSKWRIKLNQSKTQYMVFTNRRTDIPPLVIDSYRIYPKDNCKYLGIVLDKKLNYQQHLNHIKKKTGLLIHQLYPIFRTQSIPLQKKVHIYKAIIRSAMLYGAPVWCTAPKRFIHALQIVQNKLARMSTGADIYTRVSTLQTLFDTPYIQDVVNNLTQNILNTIQTNTNPIIRNIM